MAARGILQPLTERRIMGSSELAHAMALAERDAQDEGELGVAGQAVSSSRR